MANIKEIEKLYRGFEIVKISSSYHGTDYYHIYQQGIQYSQMCLASIKAAKNVIDTHCNNIKKLIITWN